MFLKILGLKGKVPNAFAGSWFLSLMVLFTKEYFLISVLCFLPLILEHDKLYPNSKAFTTCHVQLSKPIPQSTL
jgi:hypothetical protein